MTVSQWEGKNKNKKVSADMTVIGKYEIYILITCKIKICEGPKEKESNKTPIKYRDFQHLLIIVTFSKNQVSLLLINTDHLISSNWWDTNLVKGRKFIYVRS